jgi:hypothetical protein
VENHVFWSELAIWISGEHSPVNPKDASLRNRDLAYSYCWICALYQSAQPSRATAAATAKKRKPASMQWYQQFCTLGWIPVCLNHNEDICQSCCRSADAYDEDLGLADTDDQETFGCRKIDTCEDCRTIALYNTQGKDCVEDFQESRVAEEYVFMALGTARVAGEALKEAEWLNNHSRFQEILSELDEYHGWKAWKRSHRYKDRLRGSTMNEAEWVNSRGFTEKVGSNPRVEYAIDSTK